MVQLFLNRSIMKEVGIEFNQIIHIGTNKAGNTQSSVHGAQALNELNRQAWEQGVTAGLNGFRNLFAQYTFNLMEFVPLNEREQHALAQQRQLQQQQQQQNPVVTSLRIANILAQQHFLQMQQPQTASSVEQTVIPGESFKSTGKVILYQLAFNYQRLKIISQGLEWMLELFGTIEEVQRIYTHLRKIKDLIDATRRHLELILLSIERCDSSVSFQRPRLEKAFIDIALRGFKPALLGQDIINTTQKNEPLRRFWHDELEVLNKENEKVIKLIEWFRKNRGLFGKFNTYIL